MLLSLLINTANQENIYDFPLLQLFSFIGKATYRPVEETVKVCGLDISHIAHSVMFLVSGCPVNVIQVLVRQVVSLWQPLFLWKPFTYCYMFILSFYAIYNNNNKKTLCSYYMLLRLQIQYFLIANMNCLNTVILLKHFTFSLFWYKTLSSVCCRSLLVCG